MKPSDRQWDFDRPLPHSVEAERAVIGAALLMGELPLETVSLSPSDFYLELHKISWGTMQRLTAVGTPIDLVTVKDALTSTYGTARGLGMTAELARVLDEQWRKENIAHYVRIVHEKAALRSVISFSYELMNKAYSDGTETHQLLLNTGERIRELQQNVVGQRTHGFVLKQWSLSRASFEEGLSVDWLAEGVLARGDLAILVGDGGVGKSKMAAGAALSFAFGKSLWGAFKVRTPGRVVYINEERPDLTMRHLHTLAPSLGIDPGEIEKRIALLGRGPRPWRVTDPEAAQALVELLRQLGDIALIIWDSLHVLHDQDENDNSQMTQVIEGFRTVCNSTGSAGLLLHHTRKNEFGASGMSARGATAIKDTVDVQFLVRCPDKERPGEVRIVQDKTRRALIAPFLLRLEHDTQGDVTSIAWLGKAPKKIDEALEAVLEIIKASPFALKSGEIALKLAGRFGKDLVYKALEMVRKENLASWREGKPQGFVYGSGQEADE